MIEFRWLKQPDKKTTYTDFSGVERTISVIGDKVLQFRDGAYAWPMENGQPEVVWSGTDWQDVPVVEATTEAVAA